MTMESLLCDLAACLCAELTPDGATEPDLCFCDVVPGQIFAHDYAWQCADSGKCGAAWVRLVTAYPASGLGIPAEPGRPCGVLLGADIELGVIRCLEQESNGEAPPAPVMNAAAIGEIGDMLAIRRAIACCPALADLDFALNTFQPIGPAGMVTGGTWSISVVL